MKLSTLTGGIALVLEVVAVVSLSLSTHAGVVLLLVAVTALWLTLLLKDAGR